MSQKIRDDGLNTIRWKKENENFRKHGMPHIIVPEENDYVLYFSGKYIFNIRKEWVYSRIKNILFKNNGTTYQYLSK